MDLYLTDAGDIAVSGTGDLALTPTVWRDDVQQAYFRSMTDAGDFLLAPLLGASLSQLYGQPQSPATGQMGIDLITGALQREGRFAGKPINVQAIPTGPQTIRFDITITSGSLEQIKLSVQQDLVFTQA